ncbi:MAG: class I SAM-dependent DNA methyltransferase, partial [Bacteroidetes bacterium]|nr:class I SAM-dependent DNA methyltransferase [Bacteroidota bacterium]
YDEKVPRTDEDGEPVTRWDGMTMKEHPATGEMVPDETARVPVYDYKNPKRAEWPEADFIIGNPPFIGSKRMISALGEGYTKALRKAYSRRVTKGADLVMYWWYKASERVRKGDCERFGLISTNSIKQAFNRKVIDKAMNASDPLSLAFAVPDHPWVDSKDGAAVRISMTVGVAGSVPGKLITVKQERKEDGISRSVELEERVGNILTDLTIGADVAGTEALQANDGLAHVGVQLNG